ncbi:MAG TPA: DUF2948 family protein [Methyloceanibacter sp.]|nr:DUF2948 family protein [Methyloceanibacter sp.]
MNPLKLIALDEEDLAVVSSLLQDAVIRVADMTYLPGQKRFAAILNRFYWEKAVREESKDYRRRRTALRFDRVFGAKLKNVTPGTGERVLSLLAVSFEPAEPPGGFITLAFSGDATIRLQVECIEAELRDLGLEWRTRSKPEHPGLEPGEPGAGTEPGANAT